jgi:tRNA(fMet)-specific endonuclease VapC
MIYALDANIISFLLRPGKNQDVVQKFEETIGQEHDYIFPPFSHYEVLWHLLRKDATAQLRAFERLYQKSSAKISMDEADFLLAAKIKAHLEEQGTPIGHADIFIAAYCLNRGYILVTDNVDDFERIEGLQYVNWKNR